MADYKKGVIQYLFSMCGMNAANDPLDKIIQELWPKHNYLSDKGEVHKLDQYDDVVETLKLQGRVGFEDRIVRDQLWFAAAVQKAAVYDQFYTFGCWFCPTLCNAMCCPCVDTTELKKLMETGQAQRMTCGNWCGKPPPEDAVPYSWGRKDELIIIASCPNDNHGYYTKELYDATMAALNVKYQAKKGVTGLEFVDLPEKEDPKDQKKKFKSKEQRDFETVDQVVRENLSKKQTGPPQLPVDKKLYEWLSIFRSNVASEPPKPDLGIIPDPEEPKDKKKRSFFSCSQPKVEEHAKQAHGQKKEVHAVDVSEEVEAKMKEKEESEAQGAKTNEKPQKQPEAKTNEQPEDVEKTNSNAAYLHTLFQRIAEKSEGRVIHAPVMMLPKRLRKNDFYKDRVMLDDFRADAVNTDNRNDLWMAYWTGNVKQAMSYALNKYWVKRIKVVAIYGGGGASVGERKRLHTMGVNDSSKKTARDSLMCLFDTGMYCGTCGGYGCVKSCPGCSSGVYMAESMVLRFGLCADPREVPVDFVTVDAKDLVDYLWVGDDGKNPKTKLETIKEFDRPKEIGCFGCGNRACRNGDKVVEPVRKNLSDEEKAEMEKEAELVKEGKQKKKAAPIPPPEQEMEARSGDSGEQAKAALATVGSNRVVPFNK